MPANDALAEDPSVEEPTASLRPTDGEYERAGPYTLLEDPGKAGMGIVYLAEQSAPVRGRVAPKVIGQGKDTKHVVARFEAEQQALAPMDHPAIAKIFDVGTPPMADGQFGEMLWRLSESSQRLRDVRVREKRSGDRRRSLPA